MAQAQVFFQGINSSGQKGLWVTDGTTAGTFELTPISGAYTGGVTPSGGLLPSSMVVFNGDVLFGGRDPSGTTGLWVTDGTAAGTSELTPISGANTSTSGGIQPGGLAPFDLTVFNGEVLFGGADMGGNDGLWVTDGTAAGTHELTGIAGANTSGGIFGTFIIGLTPLNPYMTVFNNEVLFAGYDDTRPNPGLWVSDGTVAGTHELTGMTGMTTNGLAPVGLVVFDGEVLFGAFSTTSGHGDLWTTDGTVGGTLDLTGISGANTAGLEPFDLVVFNNEVLFSGNNTAGLFSLWVTDGTVLGTHEITGINGAYFGGVTHVFDPEFTVLNGEVLFEGEDSASDFGLWVTDGTGAGTFELTGISGANTNGIFAGINAPFFTVLNGEVLFEGSNSNGKLGLWVTDGTAGGTHEVTGISGANTSSGITPLFLTLLQTGPALSNVTNSNYTEEGAAVILSSSASIADPGSPDLVSATVAITGGAFAGDSDLLAAATTGTSIAASYNVATETLTLAGTDTLAHYQQVLDSVTFSAGENPTNFGSNPTRTVTWTINDGAASSTPVTSTVSITNVDDPPTLSNVAASATFTQGGGAVTVSSAASVSDPDNLTLVGATVAITAGTFAGDGDVLAANVSGTSIAASYNAATETLTLSGSDTLAHYKQVLDSVTFNSTSGNPSDFGSNPTRTVTWVLNDGSGSSNLSTARTETVNIIAINQPPALTGVAPSASFTEESPATTLSGSVTVSDPDDTMLASATVSITGGKFAGDGDVLATSTSGTSITASYDSANERLVLSGTDTLADYQSVLDKVTFSEPGDNPTNYGSNPTRTITWVLNDGHASNNLSTAQTETLNVIGVNDQPTLANVAATVGFHPQHTITVSPSLQISDPDNLTLSSAMVAITAGGFAGDGDVLTANTAGTGITASYNSTTETLSLTGTDTLAHYQSVLDSVTFASGHNPQNGNSNRTRTVTWTVNDGGSSNNLATATTTIAINDPSNSPDPLSMSANLGPRALGGDLLWAGSNAGLGGGGGALHWSAPDGIGGSGNALAGGLQLNNQHPQFGGT